jgi:hypothetical protein
MADHKDFNELMPGDCRTDCQTVYDFMRLTDEMVNTIIDLDEEIIRWRQALIKYLPDEWADGLQQDILDNLSRDFEGGPPMTCMSAGHEAALIHNRNNRDLTEYKDWSKEPIKPASNIYN